MKNLLFLVFILVLINGSIFSQNVTKKYFGFSLQPNYSYLITFVIVEVDSKGVVNRTFMERKDWLHQLVGIQTSVANPSGKNLLKDAGIDGPDVINELWKLRYSETPYGGQAIEKGWAGKPTIPSNGQMEMLKKFGVNSINDFFYGENLINLLKAMQDPGWVAEYQNR
jgi:hypothetical protein